MKARDPAFDRFLKKENYEKFQRGDEYLSPENEAASSCEHEWKPTLPPIRWARPGEKPRPSSAVFVCERCGKVRT